MEPERVTGGTEQKPPVPLHERRPMPRNGGGERLIRAGMLAGAAAALGAAAATRRSRSSAAAWTGAAAVAAPLATRGMTGEWPVPRALRRTAPLDLTETLVIDRSPEEVYDAWRDLEKLPGILRHLETVQVLGDTRSRWVARTPNGRRLEWEAEITEDRRGEILRWRSVPQSKIDTQGHVKLRPWRPDGGTMIEVRLRFAPLTGGLPGAAASLARPVLAQGVREDMRRFKNRMEAGEVPRTEGQTHGERSPFAPSSPF